MRKFAEIRRGVVGWLCLFAAVGGGMWLSAFANDIPVKGAAFHVDASDSASMTTVVANGKTWVTRWNDTDGGSVYATPGNRPYLSMIGGRQVVDFGSKINNTGTESAGVGCRLSWSPEHPHHLLREVVAS